MSKEQFIIEGGKPLKGEIEVRGAKNATFPLLAAALLTQKECTLENIPLIEDVFRMIEILKSMGAEIDWIGERSLKIKAQNINPSKIDESIVTKLRGSVLLFGPLLARFKKVKLPQPGGCIIGARPIFTHLDAFAQLGVRITRDNSYFILEAPEKLQTNQVILNEFSVTGTENILLFLSAYPQKTIIKIADGDYSVQELGKFLQKMGVKIEGLGTHTITIEGKQELIGAQHKIIFDPIEAGTFILIAAVTKGTVLVKNVEIRFLELALKKMKDFGLPYEIKDNDKILVKPWPYLKIDKIQAMPYPGVPTDLLPLFGVLATQTEGLTLLHDPLYEGRLKYLEELNRMGAQIIFADPHRAIVNGPTSLYGIEVNSPDLRGGASLIAGALIAKGQTIINNIYQIDRGYEKIEERLQKLGADIKRVKS
ncbi:UDP-N-acetylglucosamine 1-carboxyvinyltransferase [bacterium]|nr:UDP-N-acetylglucosamine 1-carboxyvinyltransferase [bacterium]